MNKLHENAALSLERIVFFSDAVFAIGITLLVLEIRVPHIESSMLSEAAVRAELLHLLPKILGFLFSFLLVGLMWIEHHRIFRYIVDYDFGLIWRNLLFLLFVAFIPFPTALFSEYFTSQTAFLLYVGIFGAAALGKLWIWSYVASRRESLIAVEIDDSTISSIRRRSWAVPIACVMAILLSFIAIPFGTIAFPLIPLLAKLLDRKKVEAPA